jgi:hypothetical protein
VVGEDAEATSQGLEVRVIGAARGPLRRRLLGGRLHLMLVGEGKREGRSGHVGSKRFLGFEESVERERV